VFAACMISSICRACSGHERDKSTHKVPFLPGRTLKLRRLPEPKATRSQLQCGTHLKHAEIVLLLVETLHRVPADPFSFAHLDDATPQRTEVGQFPGAKQHLAYRLDVAHAS
jgi:hypothetical protein